MKFIEWNRTGMSRDVLCIGRWALKFPKLRTWRAFLIGLLENMQERDLWKRGDWPQLLCPVVFALPGGWLVVMGRATPLTDAQAEGFDPLAILEQNDGLAIPAEPKASSFGMLDGRLVVVDYGDNPN